VTGPIPPRRWWGWAERPGDGVPEAGLAMLREELGGLEAPQPRVALEDVRLPIPRLPKATRAQIESIVGEENVVRDRLERVSHALGKSYPDLVRIRSGDGGSAPDAVVCPGSHDEVAAVLRACAEARVAVTPFGGGTSVVGGVEPRRDGLAGAISLDLRRLDRVDADVESLTATLGAGLTGPAAEALLARRGLTLGHHPQSWEFATIGGYVATRSAGQASTGYGRIDEMVLGLRLAAPVGEVVVKPHPASAAGPALRELLVGSEGALGAITEATLAVRRVPEVRRYEGWSFRTFSAGVEAFRRLEQEHLSPDVARLSDEEETRVSLALSASGSAAQRAGLAYLRLRGHAGGSIVICGFEGDTVHVAVRRALAGKALREAGGLALGGRPGRSWLRNRYLGPYLRDDLLDAGVMVETLETATSWSNLLDLHRAVREALRGALEARGTPPIVWCHVSHLYPSGASLYFTFVARQERGAEIEQWRAAKSAACDAIVANGGTITHHHAIGTDHLPWMEAEIGPLGLELLRGAKRVLDPQGIMNPGKLVPPE
jgi:alkyldihydroxyacetonephosphate synthase